MFIAFHFCVMQFIAHVHCVILLLCLLCRLKAHEPNDTEINIHIYIKLLSLKKTYSYISLC